MHGIKSARGAFPSSYAAFHLVINKSYDYARAWATRHKSRNFCSLLHPLGSGFVVPVRPISRRTWLYDFRHVSQQLFQLLITRPQIAAAASVRPESKPCLFEHYCDKSRRASRLMKFDECLEACRYQNPSCEVTLEAFFRFQLLCSSVVVHNFMQIPYIT